MNSKPPVRLVKNAERKVPQIQVEMESGAGSNRWSAAVRSWVVEFQQHRRGESLPAFDSLFKDALPQSGRAD